jgi:predicted amino acid-binding ACT domain protein
MLRDPQSDAVSSRNEQGERYFLTLTGRDAPGVLAKISGRLAREQVDIIELYGLRRADDGTFAIVFELDVPRGIDAAAVCAGIEELGGSIGLTPASSARPTSCAPCALPRAPRSLRLGPAGLPARSDRAGARAATRRYKGRAAGLWLPGMPARCQALLGALG